MSSPMLDKHSMTMQRDGESERRLDGSYSDHGKDDRDDRDDEEGLDFGN